jgi:hypothetical protein
MPDRITTFLSEGQSGAAAKTDRVAARVRTVAS